MGATGVSATAARVGYSVVQIGCGVVGDAYARAFVRAGHKVYGVEASRKRIAEVTEYEMHHVEEDMSFMKDLNFILLSINTPLDPKVAALDMKYLWSSLKNVAQMVISNPKALVVIRSTVTIGFCASYKAQLEKDVGFPVRLCFQPEFLRAKSALEDALRPWQVVLGCDKEADIADYFKFQQQFIAPEKIVFCSVDEAEVMKIFHNSFNAAKISFFNQAHLLINELREQDGKDIDSAKVFKIIGKTCEGLLNPKYGLTPGHAYYGTCLPKDSAELAHMEKSYGLQSNIFQSVVDVNNVVKAQDKEEVLHGDNHMMNDVFLVGSPLEIPTLAEHMSRGSSSGSSSGNTSADEMAFPGATAPLAVPVPFPADL